MESIKRWIYSSSLMAMALLGGASQAQAGTTFSTTLSSQMAGMSGVGLTGAECRQRMERLEVLLWAAGYANKRAYINEDRLLMASWYNGVRNTTVVAYAGQLEAGNAFSAAEVAGAIPWNEFISLP